MYFTLAEGQNDAGYRGLLGKFAELVRDAVQMLCRAWEQIQAPSYAEQKHYPLVVLLLTRHICEQLDGVSILAEKGCADPIKPLLRSSFEAMLGIEYILAADSERRGIAYQVAHAHRQIKLYRKVDPEEQSGKQLRAVLASDPLASGMEWPKVDTKKLIANLERMLARSEYAPINSEWDRLKGKAKWFALFDGPKDVHALAAKLNRVGMYEFLYRHWSNAVHAGDCLSNIGGKSGNVAIKPIRHPEGLQSMISVSIGLCLAVTPLLLTRWGTADEQEQFRADYIAQIQPRFEQLHKGELINAPWK